MSENNRFYSSSQFENKPGKMSVSIIDEEIGTRRIERVKAIRIQSDEYVLLIMEDYSPTLGEIDGNVTFLTSDEEIKYESIKGFYRLAANEFSLVIREK